jgi:general secretion pathway protein J
MRYRHDRGFTLLELLVALSVFALMSVMAYGGLRAVLDARAVTDQAAERLAQLQLAEALLGRDFEQLVARPRRDEFGYWEASLLYSPNATPSRLQLLRIGGADEGSGALTRIAWELQDGTLYRLYWARVDGSGNEPTGRLAVLGLEPEQRVEAWELRFLEQGTQGELEYSAWPPPRTEAGTAPLPQAVEVSLELAGVGRITRLFPVQRP